MGGVYFVNVLFWALCQHLDPWIKMVVHTPVFVSTVLSQRVKWDRESVIPDALFSFKNCHISSQEICFQRNRSERRRSQGKGCTHCQSMLPKFTVSFLSLRSGEDEVLQLVSKTQMLSVKSWSSSSSTTLKRFFPYAAHFPSLFLSHSPKSWLKNVFLTWIDESKIFFFAPWISGQMCQ